MAITQRNGGCLCGSVRYTVQGEPQLALCCHCTFCQAYTGSAHSSVAYCEREQVDMSGDTAQYAHRSDESGRPITVVFCPRCGTCVATFPEARAGWTGIQIGTLDDPVSVTIERYVWARSKRPDTAIPPDVDVFERGSSGGAAPIRRSGPR